MAHEEIKKRVAEKALELLKPGMKVGIGTGSTIFFFIEALKRQNALKRLEIRCIATSTGSKKLLGDRFSFLDDSLIDTVDITFDGADRIDPKDFTMIKGGGGALLREKMVALASKQNVILVDYTKIASPLGGFPVAIEIVSFGVEETIRKIKKAGYKGALRKGAMEKPFLTDNQNMIFDITFSSPILDPKTDHIALKEITGVVETGFFFNIPTDVFIGEKNATVRHIRNKESS
jgi:ribose 5-phosphate isomerase A